MLTDRGPVGMNLRERIPYSRAWGAQLDQPRLFLDYRPPRGTFVEVDVPEQQFWAVEGRGDPNTATSYARAVQALYTVAYTLRFTLKHQGIEAKVGPLEGLWRTADPAAFAARDKDSWSWTMLLVQPPAADETMLAGALAAARTKKPALADTLELVQSLVLHEGRSLQTLHVGSYDDEAPMLAKLHRELLPELGFVPSADHHEIYLNDARRTAPEEPADDPSSTRASGWLAVGARAAARRSRVTGRTLPVCFLSQARLSCRAWSVWPCCLWEATVRRDLNPNVTEGCGGPRRSRHPCALSRLRLSSKPGGFSTCSFRGSSLLPSSRQRAFWA